ncbi:MAG: M23 family metallopeptidase [Proteobacteria bacterium]|nr:M23 family metallopeptidase [Pseudomonadota bacterium]
MIARRRLLAGAGLAVGGLGLAGWRALAAPAGEFVLSGRQCQGGWLRGLAPPGTRRLTLDGQVVAMAPDRAFLLAFDRDAAPGARLVAELGLGRELVQPLAIAPRHWAIEQIPLGPPPGAPPNPEFERRRAAERAAIEAARALDHGGEGWRQPFRWPVAGRLSGHFGAQRIYRGTPGSFHSGADVAAPAGTAILAPADGTVILAAREAFTLEGHLLMLDHGMGLNSALLHCSALLVDVGQKVRQGEVVARVGMSGRATGPHLHWSLKWHEARLDPELFAGA